MYKTLVLDIETVGTSRQDVIDYIAANIKPPATYKKAESIEAWYKEQGPAAIAEEVAKTSLSGAFGQVVCIGYQLDDMEAPFVMHGLNERELLEGFSKMLLECVDQKDAFATTVVGHFISGFDLRFLVQRYIVNNIRPPAIIKRAADAKPWQSELVYDTMVQWAGVGNRISLDKLCLALNIKSPKGEIDGSKVGEFVAAGRISEVADYCRNDVTATKAVYQRMTFS